MKKTIKILLFITFMFLILSIATNVKAATATIKASTTSVQVGEKVTLSININAASWSLTVSGNGVATKKYADVTSDGTVGNRTETITLDTSAAGEKVISLKGTVSEPSGNGTKKTEIDTSVKVTVKEKTNTNTNPSGGNSTDKPEEPKKGTLSTCYINGIKVNEYLTVKNKESVSFAVNTSTKEGATIYNSNTKETYNVKSGATTNIKIAEGTNTLTITLASGNKYTRKIYSQKEEAEVKPNIIDEPEEKFLLKSLVVKAKDDNNEEIEFTLTPGFFKEAFEYLITIPEEQNYITKLDIEAVGQKSEYVIEVTGNEELKDGENVITILVKSKDGTKSTKYEVKVNKVPKPEQTAPVVAPVETPKDDNKNDNKIVNIIKAFIVGFTLIVLLAGIIFAVIEYEYGKTKNEYKQKKAKNEKTEEKLEKNVEEDDYKIRFSSISYEEPSQDVSTKEEDAKKKGKHF